MNLVEWLQGLMTSFGASWVMWLMIFLSVISVAIMLERGYFYFTLRDDIPKLAHIPGIGSRFQLLDDVGRKRRGPDLRRKALCERGNILQVVA